MDSEIKIHWRFWLIFIVALIWNIKESINFIIQMSPDMLASYQNRVFKVTGTNIRHYGNDGR